MFAKRSKQSSQRQPPSDDGSQTEQSGSDSRDDAADGIEGELEEQRAAAQSLRAALDAAMFKIETLEKSYATQLAEVRDKRAALEAELKEKDEILANLGGPHEHTLRELNDALTVIKVLKNERDKLRKQIAEGGFRQPTRTTKARELLGADSHIDGGPVNLHAGDTASRSGDDTSDGTINALIANAGWAEKKPRVGNGGQATALVDTGQEPPQQEMLSPDLVFTEKDKEKEGDR